MAPGPVIALESAILVIVLPIGPVLNHEIASVGAVFAVVPVVIVIVIAIKNANLHAGLLRLWRGHNYSRRSKGSSQNQRTYVSIEIAHDVFLLKSGMVRIPVELTMSA